MATRATGVAEGRAPRHCASREISRISWGSPKSPKAAGRDGPRVSPGRPWRARFFPACRSQGGPGQKCPGATRRDFRQPVSGFNFCLWVWHAAEAPLEGRRDAPWTMAERLLRSPAVAPQWSLLPGKSNLGCPRQSSLPSIQEKSCFALDPTPSTKRFI